VIDWADRALGMGLSQASKLQGVVAVGIAIGAIMAARRITLRGSVRVIPLGIAMGLLVPLMVLVSSLWLAVPLLVLIGACAGFFVVPMNALLQHRGHMLMGAGHSIAVQNFNENLSRSMDRSYVRAAFSRRDVLQRRDPSTCQTRE
jgi:LPLT family lysophospholipid transporter-like MFS transporter